MEILTLEIKGLRAAKGMRLTNGETYSDPEETIYLGANDKPENWYEVTEAEYEKIQERQMGVEE